MTSQSSTNPSYDGPAVVNTSTVKLVVVLAVTQQLAGHPERWTVASTRYEVLGIVRPMLMVAVLWAKFP